MTDVEKCTLYDQCGFVAFRREASGLISPLPTDGSCGISPENCGRALLAKGYTLINLGPKRGLDFKGFIFENESKIGLIL